MKRTTRLVSRSLFPAAVLGALAFGAAQAVAAPASPASFMGCVRSECNARCVADGYPEGRCFTNGECVCVLWP